MMVPDWFRTNDQVFSKKFTEMFVVVDGRCVVRRDAFLNVSIVPFLRNRIPMEKLPMKTQAYLTALKYP